MDGDVEKTVAARCRCLLPLPLLSLFGRSHSPPPPFSSFAPFCSDEDFEQFCVGVSLSPPLPSYYTTPRLLGRPSLNRRPWAPTGISTKNPYMGESDFAGAPSERIHTVPCFFAQESTACLMRLTTKVNWFKPKRTLPPDHVCLLPPTVNLK